MDRISAKVEEAIEYVLHRLQPVSGRRLAAHDAASAAPGNHTRGYNSSTSGSSTAAVNAGSASDISDAERSSLMAQVLGDAEAQLAYRIKVCRWVAHWGQRQLRLPLAG